MHTDPGSKFTTAIRLACTDKRMRFACAAVAMLVVINLFYLGTKPFAVGLFVSPWDKLAHAVTFSILTMLLWFSTAGRMTIGIVVIVSICGALDEWHQAFLPGRSADIEDWLMDFGSAAITAAILSLYAKQQTLFD